MHFRKDYKDYKLTQRDVDVQLSIHIPKTVVEYLHLRKGDVLRLRVDRGRMNMIPVRRRDRK